MSLQPLPRTEDSIVQWINTGLKESCLVSTRPRSNEGEGEEITKKLSEREREQELHVTRDSEESERESNERERASGEQREVVHPERAR